MSDRVMLWILLAILGIGAVVGIAGLVLAQRPKPPSSGGGNSGGSSGSSVIPNGELEIRVKPNRAVGNFDYIEYEDETTVEYAIYQVNKLITTGKIEGLRADEYQSKVIELPQGYYTMYVYYPGIEGSKTRATAEFYITGNSRRIVNVVVDISEPEWYIPITIVTPYSDMAYDALLLDGSSTKHFGAVNGGIVSWLMQFYSKIDRILIDSTPQTHDYFILTNVKLAKDLRAKLHTPKHSNDSTQTTLEVLVFRDSIPYKDCKAIVYKGEEKIIEKDLYSVGDGEYGIREVINRSEDSYTVEIIERNITAGSITLNALTDHKVHVFLFDLANRWR